MSSVPAADADAGDDAPRLLPLRGTPATPLVELLAPLVAAARQDRGGRRLRVTCAVDESLTIDGDADLLGRAVAALLRRAVDAALTSDPESDLPPLGEVVVTAVRTPLAIEIEVADSGPAMPQAGGMNRVKSVRDGLVAEAEMLVARCGGTLNVGGCPEGGTAVTLRLPYRLARGMAA